MAAQETLSRDELEDDVELRDPKVIRQLKKSQEDLLAGRVGCAWALLDELKKAQLSKSKK